VKVTAFQLDTSPKQLVDFQFLMLTGIEFEVQFAR
jgi:hypothetical protein